MLREEEDWQLLVKVFNVQPCGDKSGKRCMATLSNLKIVKHLFLYLT